MLNKVVWLCTGFVLALTLMFVSCENQLNPSAKVSPIPNIEQSQRQVGDVSKTLDTTTKDIKVEAQHGMQQTPEAAKPMLEPHWTKILTDAGTQDDLVMQMQGIQKDLGEAKSHAADVEKQRDGYYAENQDLKQSENKALRAKYTTMSLALFGIAIVMGGIGIWMQGNKAILAIAALCGTGCIVCIFLVQTVQLIPFFVGGIALLGLGVLFYSFYKKHADLMTFKNATTQLVKTVENTKPFMTVQGRKKIFGDGAVVGIAHILQTNTTQDVVATLRNDIEKAPAVAGTVASDVPVQGVPAQPNSFPGAGTQGADVSQPPVQSPLDTVDYAASPYPSPQLKRRVCSRKITGGPTAQRVLFV